MAEEIFILYENTTDISDILTYVAYMIDFGKQRLTIELPTWADTGAFDIRTTGEISALPATQQIGAIRGGLIGVFGRATETREAYA